MSGWTARVRDHWFAPASLRELGVVRVVLVASQLLLFMPTLDLGYQLWLAAADPVTWRPLAAMKVLLLPLAWGARPSPLLLTFVWWTAVATGITALVGWRTRLSLVVFAVANVFLIAHAYSYGEAHHREAIMMLALFLLAFAPSGSAYAVDGLGERWRAARAASRFAPATPADDLSPDARWPLRAVQWLFVLIYVSAGQSKLTEGGLDWFNGYTLAYHAAIDGVARDASLGVWLAQHLWAAAVLSVIAVIFELTFALAVLVPRLAPAYVAVGTALHAGIWVVQRAPFFQFIACYAVFIEPLRRRWAPGRAAAPRWTVIYDGLCPLCIRSMTTLDYLDGRGRLAYVDFEGDWAAAVAAAPGLDRTAAEREMMVVAPDGRRWSGFFAFRRLTHVLPALWWLAPFVYLPLASRVGPRVYAFVAGRRGRVVCRADACAT